MACAEVEQLLDTPVKRYSSGMYVRLAFAVAAHLEPEILAVDEVLALGDADFQKKCLGKCKTSQISRDEQCLLSQLGRGGQAASPFDQHTALVDCRWGPRLCHWAR